MWRLVFPPYTGDHVDQQGDAYFTFQTVSQTLATSAADLLQSNNNGSRCGIGRRHITGGIFCPGIQFMAAGSGRSVGGRRGSRPPGRSR